MTDDSPLFRPAAMAAQRTQWHGEIVMTQPLSYRLLSWLAGCFACAVLAFGIFGSYTKRHTAHGQLVPNTGLVKIHAQQPGIVVEERVKEGQRVKKGDVLFVLSSERKSDHGETQAAISQQVQSRQESLRQQQEKTQQLLGLEKRTLQDRSNGLRAEIAKLKSLIEGQRARTALAEEASRRYKAVQEQGYITQDQLIQRQADALDQRARLETLERELIAARQQQNDADNQLAMLPLKYGNQLADLDRSVAGTEQELVESEARRRLSVIAAETGTVTAITGRLGQAIDPSQPLASIIPEGAALQAHLFAPSRAMGFIKSGDTVRIRYQAFPYQKFGQYQGIVTDVATTALSSAELTGRRMAVGEGSNPDEPVFRITVELSKQAVNAYGRQQPLQSGMLLDADILQERRRLYEWVLEPLYSLTGRL